MIDIENSRAFPLAENLFTFIQLSPFLIGISRPTVCQEQTVQHTTLWQNLIVF